MPRFTRRGNEKVYYCPTIVSTVAPSVAEVVTAGKDLTSIIRSFTGFTFGGSTVDAADMGSLFPKTLPGMQTLAQSGITIYEGDTATDQEKIVELLLVQNVTGYLVFSASGTPAASKKVRVWPVSVLSNSPDESGDAVAATVTIGFNMPANPTIYGTMA